MKILRKDPPGGFKIKEENESNARITLEKNFDGEGISLDVVYTQQVEFFLLPSIVNNSWLLIMILVSRLFIQ